MRYSFPYFVTVDDTILNIRNKCDFRVVLDVIEALNDNELTEEEKLQCALYIFYGDELTKTTNYDEAIKQMFIVINGGEEETEETEQKPRLMDWNYDFPMIAPPMIKILGYDVRNPDKFTHWWTVLGGYMELGESTFSTIISIRRKRQNGKPLDKNELEFYRENRKLVDLPHNLTPEEQAWLNSEW